MSEEDPSIVSGLWETGEAAWDAAGHAVESSAEAVEAVGDVGFGFATHVAATAAFGVGATDTADDWQESAESWYEEGALDAEQALNESLGWVDAVAGTDYYDPTIDDTHLEDNFGI